MNVQIKEIENISNNFDLISKGNYFSKEKITDLYFPNKFKINFNDCHVAISKNGGLIAICKKNHTYFDIQKNSYVNNNILVIQQNAKQLYTIPISWDYSKRWLVGFDFSENENLYGICNDGVIYKFDLLLREAKELLTGKTLIEQGINKVKFIEKGFIALTGFDSFYYINDFKNITPKSLFQIKSMLEFSKDEDLDFIAIPPQASKSGKLELLFTNQKGDGVIHITEQPDNYNYRVLPLEIDGKTKITVERVFELKEDELKPIIKIESEDEIINSENNDNNNNAVKSMGKIIAMAISPSYKQVAFYNNKGNAYIFSSKFDNGRKEISFDINKNLTKEEQEDINVIIKFNKNFQFLFCGEDALALYGNKFILIADINKKTLTYKIIEDEDQKILNNGVYAKCISEIDGIRIATNEGIYFISEVDKNLFKSCYPFEKNKARNLLKAYFNDLINEPDCMEKITDIGKDLNKSIFILLNAATNIFYIDEESSSNKKEAQMHLIKAAQFGKLFVKEEENFNYYKFIDICKDLRIVNNLRNNKETPIFITYKEYKNINWKELIKKILLQNNFNLAYQISKYFNYDTKKIYQKWACCKIKKLNKISTIKEQMNLYEDIIYDLERFKNVSYIQLAKKAFKCHQNELAMKFLEKEKSILAKIPIYLKQNKLEKVLELSFETYDLNIISFALSQLMDYQGIDKNFINKVKDMKNMKFAILDFLKKNGGDLYVDEYLEAQGDYEDLMFYELEKFFTSNKYDMKKKHLNLAKEYLKKLDKNNINNKFYFSYLNELTNSIKFKKECMDSNKKIIPKNYIMPFDNSIYDCYQLAIQSNESDWIEKQNKNFFELNNKKMTLMRFKTLAENNKIELIEDIIKTTSLKKLGITAKNMAEFYFEFKNYKLATKYTKLITQNEYFEYKIEMLKYMEKYEDALEITISSKDMDKIPDIVNDILMKKPDLKNKVKELCTKYKVNLS